MSQESQLLNEQESAAFAGVSVETIRQYDRFGLLKGTDVSGQTRYDASLLKQLFRVSKDPEPSTEPETQPTRTETAPTQTTAPAATPQETAPTPVAPETPEVRSMETASASQPESQTTASTVEERPTATQHAATDTTAQTAQKPRESAPQSITRPTQEASTAYAFSHPGQVSTFEQIELSKTLREQIETLKEERDWLRKRVEVLESRTERDQMLLLSEAETVRSVLREKRGFSLLGRALPWFNAGK